MAVLCSGEKNCKNYSLAYSDTLLSSNFHHSLCNLLFFKSVLEFVNLGLNPLGTSLLATYMHFLIQVVGTSSLVRSYLLAPIAYSCVPM